MNFKAGKEMYMMPANFGPCGGPRRKPDGRRFISDGPIKTTQYLSFCTLADPEQVEQILPDCMSLTAPMMVVGVQYLKEIPWLAKKQYALISVNFPVRVESDEGALSGLYMSAIWENHVDPILTGREQLGFCKILCEISDPLADGSKVTITASEYGNKFMELNFDPTKIPQMPTLLQAAATSESDGIFHYKYMAHAEPPYDKADTNYICMSPNKYELPKDYKIDPVKAPEVKPGFSTTKFSPLTWEQSPAHYQIIQTLSNIKVKDYIGGVYMDFDSINDLYDQRVVKSY